MALVPIFQDLAEARQRIWRSRASGQAPLSPAAQEAIRAAFGEELSAEETVRRILAEVRAGGDAALRRLARAFDGHCPDQFLVPEAEVQAAGEKVSPTLRDALLVAAQQIRSFHERARRNSWLDFRDGGCTGQMIQPLDRVGVYVPGGRATYPSSLLMAAIPARVAGVREVVVCSPPGPNGAVSDSVLLAAGIAQVDAVYEVGGAQAIAAMAYGTESVPKVDKVVGPGNLFVVLAKRMVFGQVGVDGLPGPTETVVIADSSARAEWLAADMLAQAEHDPMAQSILLCTSGEVAAQVEAELESQIGATARAGVISQSLSGGGAIAIVSSVEEAISFSNEYAPEHLCLSVADPWRYLPMVRNAGGVFLGEWSVESMGDYTAGPSHIMPTGGAARFASPLGVDDFVKVTSVFAFSRELVERLGPAAIDIAKAEGLEAHAAAVESRLPAPRQAGVEGASHGV